ncbi:MAG: adenylate kinase family protein [Candidatus Nanohaloarchaea archaeon]
MIIALTGTPGTGKTSVSEELGYPVIHLTEYVKEHGLGEQREEFEVDVPAMVESLESLEGDHVIEGHLAHHVPADVCIVLRCEPGELRERLSERDYTERKVEENVESEMLDVILVEALDSQDTVVEVDTTGRTVEETVEIVKEKVEKGEPDYGSIDWTSEL